MKKARSGPCAFAAAQAASTSMERAWLRPALPMRPWWAAPSPDWRTRGFSPKQLASFWAELNRSTPPIAAISPDAAARLTPAMVGSRRIASSSSASWAMS